MSEFADTVRNQLSIGGEASGGVAGEVEVAGAVAGGEASAALHAVETNVLDEWRTAVTAGDDARIAQLVEFGHTLRDAGKWLPTAIG